MRIAKTEIEYQRNIEEIEYQRNLRKASVVAHAVLCQEAHNKKQQIPKYQGPPLTSASDWVDLTDLYVPYINLREQDMAGASFTSSDFSHGDFTHAALRSAHFASATLTHAVFTDTDLTEADFSYADLRCAQFQRARLFKVDFTGVDLRGANLNSAVITEGTVVTSAAGVFGNTSWWAAYLTNGNTVLQIEENRELLPWWPIRRSAELDGVIKVAEQLKHTVLRIRTRFGLPGKMK